MRRRQITAAAILAGIACASVSGARQERRSQSKTAFTGKLPALDGQQLTATLVEVMYPPGGSNPAHRHPCPVVGYVLEGALRMRIEGREEKVFRAGDTFFESPSDVHAVSANASADQRARFLAYFVCDRATPLSVPVDGAQVKR